MVMLVRKKVMKLLNKWKVFGPFVSLSVFLPTIKALNFTMPPFISFIPFFKQSVLLPCRIISVIKYNNIPCDSATFQNWGHQDGVAQQELRVYGQGNLVGGVYPPNWTVYSKSCVPKKKYFTKVYGLFKG